MYACCSDEEANTKKNVSFKTVNYVGCSFLIPEGTEGSGDGNSLSYTFDDKNSLTISFVFFFIFDWEDTEESIFDSVKKWMGTRLRKADPRQLRTNKY